MCSHAGYVSTGDVYPASCALNGRPCRSKPIPDERQSAVDDVVMAQFICAKGLPILAIYPRESGSVLDPIDRISIPTPVAGCPPAHAAFGGIGIPRTTDIEGGLMPGDRTKIKQIGIREKELAPNNC